MMSDRYKSDFMLGFHDILRSDNQRIASFANGVDMNEVTASHIAAILNMETAPLLATIALQNANLEAAENLLAEERAKVEGYKIGLEAVKRIVLGGVSSYELSDILRIIRSVSEETEAANDSPTG